MAEKTVNYTPEQTVAVLEAYASGTDVVTIAESMGKTARSIIAKLSREGVYQKKVYVSKTGEKVAKKDETADAIGKILGMEEAEVESLTKANKKALKLILAALS